MRLPHSILASPFFTFEAQAEFVAAYGSLLEDAERAEITRLSAVRLPPITSVDGLSLLIGINPGLTWSILNRTHKYYNTFERRKGQGVRLITAPRVSLKVIQKWLSHQLQNFYTPPDHVYGFVPGRSHIDAAATHCGSNWVYSFDITNFFPSTPSNLVRDAMQAIGYNGASAEIITSLCTLNGFLAQGAPTSPLLSNIVFKPYDERLMELAAGHGIVMTRYADDIVFSGNDEPPQQLAQQVARILAPSSWQLSDDKTHFSKSPNRLKVHGLLVHREHPRLTKGYRNKLRAFRHLEAAGRIREEDRPRLMGHIMYGDFIDNKYRN